ncbi:MAG TPA: 2TM domain-containing protein [Burkholderiaceae bacterium]|nr:2TM domain-containing protein [Burkholderiaceae bacterium]
MSNDTRDLSQPSRPQRDSIERQARRRVGMKMGWYIHALVFVLVNVGLFALNRWAHFPAYGWAVGLAIHGIVVFARLQGYGLREAMLQREIERLRRSAT